MKQYKYYFNDYASIKNFYESGIAFSHLVNYETSLYCAEIGQTAYGCLMCSNELSDDDITEFKLTRAYNTKQFTIAPAIVFQEIVMELANIKFNNYKLMFVVNKSNHPDDGHLFMVVALDDATGTYTVWSAWNAIAKSLNHGHYCLKNLNEVYKVLEENFFE